METSRRASRLVTSLLEAGPDEVDPRAAFKRLPVYYWIVSFDGVKDPKGMEVDPAMSMLDYPVKTTTIDRKDAIDLAKVALTQAGYDFQNANIIDAWMVSLSVWNELKQVWTDIENQQ